MRDYKKRNFKDEFRSINQQFRDSMKANKAAFTPEVKRFYRNLGIILLLTLLYPVGLYVMFKKSGWSKKAKTVATTIGGAFLAIIVIAAINAPPTVTLDNLKSDNNSSVEAESFDITGSVYPTDALVTINGESVKTDDKGKFTDTILLTEGDNTITVTAQKDNKQSTSTYKIHRYTKDEIAKQKADEAARVKSEADAKKAADAKAVADSKAKQDADKKATAEIKATVTPPKFDTYFNRPMADVAAELKPYLYEYNFTTKSDEPAPRDYDPNYSHQIYAKKDGYKLFFENGASSANSKYGTPEGTYNGTANIMSIELAQMGKCSFSQVFNKIDDAMKLVGLDPATKGTRDDDGGGTQQGYGSYRGYLGKDSLEIALVCDYEGANYKLQLLVLPEYR